MTDFKFKYCSYAVRVAASVARRRDPSSHKASPGQGGLGNFFPESGTRGANFIPPVARKGGRG